MFYLKYCKMMQSLYKNWLLASRIIWKIWTTSHKQWKVQKVEIWWATTFVQKKYICPKNTFLRLKHYIQRILTFFSTTCVKTHQISYVIFETISYFPRHNSDFSDLLLLALNFTKFLMSFFEPRVCFSSNFASFFSVMRHNSSLPFHLNIYMLWTKGAHKSANFQTLTVHMKVN